MEETRNHAAAGSRIKGFDGLRALSALFVFSEHKIRDVGAGAIGVWIFFCLSGYLIVGILQRARRGLELVPNASAPRALLDFWRNRALRILPIYYLVVVAVFALTHIESPRGFPYYFCYVQNFYIAFVTHQWSPITHFWSLAIEQQFYVLVAPVLIFLSARLHRSFLVALLVFCVGFTLIARHLPWDPMALSLMPPESFAFIALGGIASLSESTDTGFGILSRGTVAAVAGVIFAAVFVGTRATYDSHAGTPESIYLLGLLACGSLVAWTARQHDSRVVRLLELAPLRWLGTISYGFYVYHPLVPERWRVARWLPGVSAIPPVVWVALELAVALAAAHLSWTFFERGFLRLKRKKSAQEALQEQRATG